MTKEEIKEAFLGYDMRETVTYPSGREVVTEYQLRGVKEVRPYVSNVPYVSVRLLDLETRRTHAENFPLWEAELLLRGERIEAALFEGSVRRTLELIPLAAGNNK